MKFSSFLNLIYAALVLGLLTGAYFLIRWIINLINPGGTATWWGNLFGAIKPGTPIPDLTGSLGNDISNASQAAATAAATPQLSYDQARSTFAQNEGCTVEQVTQYGWPWNSYDDWSAAGMPALPTGD